MSSLEATAQRGDRGMAAEGCHQPFSEENGTEAAIGASTFLRLLLKQFMELSNDKGFPVTFILK